MSEDMQQVSNDAPKETAPAPVSNQAPASNVSAPAASNNASAALSYLLGLVTGIYFYATAKDKFVRFHAMQSILLSIVLIVINYILTAFVFSAWLALGFIYSLYSLAVFVLWLYMMITAYQGKKVVLPVIGPMADKKA